MDGALYTLLGVIVGAAASLLGPYLQQRQQDRRDQLRMAVDIGLQDYKQDIELARSRPAGSHLIAPVELYVNHHARMFDAIAKGELTPDKVRELKAERDLIGAAFAKSV